MSAHLDPSVRHDIVLVFDVTDGNPNGDPDAGNQPRTDDETGQGLVTDVALKRKLRDVIPEVKPDDERYGIFVEAGHALNPRIEAAKTATKGSVEEQQRWLCDRYFDIRMFGAVLSTGKKEEGSKTAGAGQIRGPLQLTFARSLDPVLPERPRHHPRHAHQARGPRQGQAQRDGIQVDAAVRPVPCACLLLREPCQEDWCHRWRHAGPLDCAHR